MQSLQYYLGSWPQTGPDVLEFSGSESGHLMKFENLVCKTRTKC